MAVPRIYYHNLFPLGVMSGTNTDEAFPVRRVADADLTLPWPVISGTEAGTIEAEARTTLASGETREAFVLVKGEGLSGFVFRVISEDVGGGNSAQHAEATAAGDTPFVLILSGVSTPRRVWRVTISGVTSGLATPTISEMMLASILDFPRRPIVGVQRVTVHQTGRVEIPGGAPFRIRFGQELKRTTYQLVAEEDRFLLSGFQTFLETNDGGEPFWFVDDLGDSYWAECPGTEYEFDDQAGVYTLGLTVQQVTDE